MTRTNHTLMIASTGLARAGFGLRASRWAVKTDQSIPVLAASGAG